jgi:hypothetical protein
LKPVSNGVEAITTAADTSARRIRGLSTQLAALAEEAKKAEGFQQAFGPLGDILDIGGDQKITQEHENKVSPGTHR